MLFAPNIEYVLIIMSDEKKVKNYDEFRGHHTNQAYLFGHFKPGQGRLASKK
jgi:hypothetical protein